MNLAAIRQQAQDRTDKQTVETSGKWSNVWWLRQINRAKDILALETGYYRKRHDVPTMIESRACTLPSSVCGPVLRATYEDDVLEHVNVYELDDDSPGWEGGESGTPLRWTALDALTIEIDPAPDRYVVVDRIILTAQAGAGFTNQPINTNGLGSAVQVVSNGADTRTITLYGTTAGTAVIVTEAVVLTGATAITTTKDDWGYILAAKASAADAARTVTIRLDATHAISTIAPAATTTGMVAVNAADQNARKVKPRARCGSVFTNQPANDGIEVLSSVADTRGVTVYGTTYATNTIVKESLTLDGTNVVASSKLDWGYLLGATTTAKTPTGGAIITIREASANAELTTIPVLTLAVGGTTAVVIGLLGTDADSNDVTDCGARIPGTPASFVEFPKKMATVTYALTGALLSTDCIYISVGAALQVLAAALPDDMAQDTETPMGLPDVFHWVLGEGAAALAEVGDLYTQSDQAKATASFQAFWNGAKQVKAFTKALTHEELGQVAVADGFGTQVYCR